MFTQRFLINKRGIELTEEEAKLIEGSIHEVKIIEPRTPFIHAGQSVSFSTLLIKGLMSRYIDDKKGRRQLVAVQLAGEFVDLHAYPMKTLDHSIGTLTRAEVGIVPHSILAEIIAPRPELARKLWFSTLLDAAMHRAWLFRLGRLDAVGRVAHFICETNARLESVGLSDGLQFELELTQTDLAEICGLTAVHVNRVIRQLREAGLCLLKSSHVEILDRAALEKRGDFNSDYLYLG